MRKKIELEIKRLRALRKKLAKKQGFKRKNKAYLNRTHSNISHVVEQLEEPCAICGVQEATTKDHVPPKGIFPKPRPQLITVPACASCNNGASDYDDLFKVYLSMQSAGNTDLATKLFESKTSRTLERNRKLISKIHDESRTVKVELDDGTITNRLGILWDSEAHEKVMERTIRGLYYHHSGRALGLDANVEVQKFTEVSDEIENLLPLLPEHVIGDEQVKYKFYISPEDHRDSVWFFEFYGVHYASGYSVPK